MDRRSVVKGAAACVAAASLPLPEVFAAGATARDSQAFNLDLPEHRLDALVKMRGDLTGAEVPWYWTGTIWAMVPGEENRKLFEYDGFSMARFEPIDGGYRMLNREVGVYRDPGTGEILRRWNNPFLEREVEVIHRFNDHVNVELMVRGRFNIGMVPLTIIGDDIWWRLDMFFLRPSPISRKDYPLNVQHDLYQGAELTMYHASLADIQNPSLTGTPATVTFTRISQWEPFMEMGNRPGQMVFHAAGRKLDGGAAVLEKVDPRLFGFIKDPRPEYLRSPGEWQHGTVSQWDAFKQMKEGGAKE